MPNLTPTVFVVDSDSSVRIALETLLRRAGWKPELFPSTDEFIAYAPRLVPGCLMLDVPLADLDALDALQRIASERKETPIIIMSSHGSIPLIVRAMKAGAVEFLSKPFVNDVVRAAVGQAINQSQVILKQETELLELRSRHDSLSHREREVMGRVVAGDLNKRIGAALGISEITVKAHRGRVMRKMGADSLADLVRMAIRLRIPPAATTPTLPSLSSRASHRMTALGDRRAQPIRIMPAGSSWMSV